jgi:ATP-binding protein involved in chromosome partitioning
VAISVGQLLPHADVLVVTTPQTAASDVAVRSGLVAAQTGQRVIGVVENMGAMTLPDGSTLDLFGAGGGDAVAASLSSADHVVPLLASFRSASICGAAATREPRWSFHDPRMPPHARSPRWPSGSRRPRGLAGRSLPVTPR